jgi:hypothetical protein
MKTGGRWGFRGLRSRARRSETSEGGATPSALPGISPSRGEIDSRTGLAHLNVWE